MKKKVYLGADHRGFKLKKQLKEYFDKQKIAYEDKGNLVYDKNDDFVDFAKLVADKVIKNNSRGILICGTAQGTCIAANKVKGVIAAPAWNIVTAKHAAANDNANILCLPAQLISFALAKKIINTWLKTKFTAKEKYKRRLKKIKKLEKIIW